MKNNNLLKTYKLKQLLITLLPAVALAVLFGVFCGMVNKMGFRLDIYLKKILNESVVLAVIATGAIFIYSLGSFDISLGASTLFSATLGVMTYNATESFGLMIAVIFGVAIGCSLLSSVLASVFHIPVYVHRCHDERADGGCQPDHLHSRRRCGRHQHSQRAGKAFG